MKNFQIEIKEELNRIIYIKAESSNDALEKAAYLYKNEDIVLDADDFTGEAEISILPKVEKEFNKCKLSFHLANVLNYLESDEQKSLGHSEYSKHHISYSISYLKKYITTVKK